MIFYFSAKTHAFGVDVDVGVNPIDADLTGS